MKHLLAITVVLTLAATCAGQASPTQGLPPFSSIQDGGFDKINRQNLNVNFALPIIHVNGRGLPLNFVIGFNSLVWQITGTAPSQTWVPVSTLDGTKNPNFGWTKDFPIGSTTSQTSTSSTRCPDGNGGFYWAPVTTYSNFQYADTLGTTHSFPVSFTYNSCTGATSGNWTAYATDNSGFYIDISSSGSVPGRRVVSPSGTVITGVLTDSNGNYLSNSTSKTGTCPPASGQACTVTTTVTDTLGNGSGSSLPALQVQTIITTSGTETTTYQYLYPDSTHTQTITLNYTSMKVRTNFGCSTVTDYSKTSDTYIKLPTSLVYPDGQTYSFSYEPTPGNSGYVTGRIAQVTLPTGGTIQYTYGGTNDGISCTTANGTNLTRVVYDGTNTSTWRYSATGTQTTVTDPTAAQNQSAFAFNSLGLPTSAKYYSGSATGTPLREVDTTYDANNLPSNVTTKLEDGTTQSHIALTYDSYARLTYRGEYDYSGTLLRQTSITYASLGNNIIDRPNSVIVKKGDGTTVATTTYTYDGGSLTTTTGTPQLASVSGSRGNLTTLSSFAAGSTFLTKTFTYFDTGNVNVATDVNGAQTGYTYGACGNSFPTIVSLPVGAMTRHMTWNCVGGVMTGTSDENGQTTATSYGGDANYWRPTQNTDQAGYPTNISYSSTNGAPSWVESALNFGATSTVDMLATSDKLGRPHISQRRQAQGAPNLDSVETDYDVMGRVKNVTLPYSAAAGVASGATGTTTSFDALGRPLQVVDLGGGTVSYSYTKNDVLQTLGPAPVGENAKQKQLQYDALGRLTSVCEITSLPGNGTCGQTQSQTGYWTTYTYDVQNNLTGVTQNAQAAVGSRQPRTYTYDGLGRMTAEQNPETGTTSYIYDSDTGCGSTSAGDLVKRFDAVGNTTCYHYDALHRVTSISYPSGSYASVTDMKCFVYDSASPPSGITLSYTESRLAEAYTKASGSCDGSSKKTDLFFSYSARGEVTDTWESTPNSNGYYHVSGSYWANGALNTLGLSIVGQQGTVIPNITYNADGEGRPAQVSAATGTNPAAGTTYNVAGQPLQLSLGSGDSDSFTYDGNTGRVTKYQFNIGTSSASGTLTWNANGTLQQNAIVDPFNSANQQTCNYHYDDLVRIAGTQTTPGVDCGANVWQQYFTYDAFGNITKNVVSGTGTSFQPTYNLYNQFSLSGAQPPVSFDLNGNTTQDNVHGYTWDAEGKMLSVDTSTVTLTYDALGRMVEQNRGGTYTQIVYGLGGGKLALMNRQTLSKAFVALPGGAVAVYGSSGTLTYFRHADWLGSARISSDAGHNIVSDLAYAPFGETYAESGSGNPDRSFTGQNQDTISNGTTGLYDFVYREYALYGRWISPDPAGMAAVSLASPQSLNRYGYVNNNPLNAVDPDGMRFVLVSGSLGNVPAWMLSSWSITDRAAYVYNGQVSEVMHKMNVATIIETQFVYLTTGWSDPTITMYGNMYSYSWSLSSLTSIFGAGASVLFVNDSGGDGGKTSQTKVPPKRSCPSLGQDTLFGAFSRVTYPLDMLTVNASMFVVAGGQFLGGGLAIGAGCADPTPFEPLTCAAGVVAGGTLIGSSAATGSFGVLFFKNYTLPALKDWGSCHE